MAAGSDIQSSHLNQMSVGGDLLQDISDNCHQILSKILRSFVQTIKMYNMVPHISYIQTSIRNCRQLPQGEINLSSRSLDTAIALNL